MSSHWFFGYHNFGQDFHRGGGPDSFVELAVYIKMNRKWDFAQQISVAGWYYFKGYAAIGQLQAICNLDIFNAAISMIL